MPSWVARPILYFLLVCTGFTPFGEFASALARDVASHASFTIALDDGERNAVRSETTANLLDADKGAENVRDVADLMGFKHSAFELPALFRSGQPVASTTQPAPRYLAVLQRPPDFSAV